MFDLAFTSHIPIIGVQTDDLPNIEAVLHALTGLKAVEIDGSVPKTLGAALYYTSNMEAVTVAAYNKLMDTEHQLIVLNPDKQSSLIFDAGTLPTPVGLIKEYLVTMVGPEDVEPLLQVLKGMSLKAIGETIMLTQARTGGMNPVEVRRTRTMISGLTQGMYSVDTAIDFYQFPTKLEEWLNLNKNYFLNPKTPHQLVPRGILLDGTPGVGKSLASKAVANFFKIPLYRLDISTALNKYQGESEGRIARILSQVEREAPCVLLIDEVEKIFAASSTDETGVISRILSQLLWWLADHQSRVLTVMTTNKLSIIPPELYRPGRIDMTIKIPRLVISEAKVFAQRVFKSVVGVQPSLPQLKAMGEALKATGEDDFSHAGVSELVYHCIKQFNWL